MQFEENNSIKKIGEETGFFFGMLLFCSLFYLILSILNKMPDYVRYAHVATGVIVIYLLGLIIKVIRK
ncbi:hypothetical protein KY366_03895 [Candidatus Woesearchaeota archaeon]|nr:hypothetical protein [Candidatus Woesearchaeota archaeon]